MNTNAALVITSIASPNEILQTYLDECNKHEMAFVLVGDRKSPPDDVWADYDFWSLDRQKKTGFNLAKNLPENHYVRKNIGYLVAMSHGANIIIETDDDNVPIHGFWDNRQLESQACLMVDKGWVNVYGYFCDANIWPRGFALDHLQDKAPDIADVEIQNCLSPIQQGLANDNPDVDAIYRLALPLPVRFKDSTNVALGEYCWCPFNSQNTTWFKDAFPLLYLPSYCSFRMTDIWRSFVAQRIAWSCGWSILFHKPTVVQYRNVHNLLDDFENELPGYLNNGKICDELGNLNLKKGAEHILDNLYRCYEHLVSKGYFSKKELGLLEAWISDYEVLKNKSNDVRKGG